MTPEPVREPVREKEGGGETPPAPAAGRKLAAQKAVDDWNAICVPHGLGAVKKLTDPRIAKIVRRIVEDFDQSRENWKAYLRRIAASPFLTGENERGWRADFDWCLEPANVCKVIEGKFDPLVPRRPSGGPVLNSSL